MIIGRIWSLNKPRKWDKVNVLCWHVCGFGNGTRVYKRDIILTLVTEGNTVGEELRWPSDVGRLVEEGTPIRITRRILAKSVTSNHIIAISNTKVDLKPWGMMMYRWCCYRPYDELTRVLHLK